jgi:biotin transporter BioY
MQEIFSLLIGIVVLLLGWPIGSYLASQTKEELKDGQKWFKLIILVAGIGVILSLIIGNDFLLFAFLFMIVVTSKSLK